MEWSIYQANIFEFVTKGQGNAVIEAVAGSGKTTTIVEAMRMIPSNRSSIFLAFNKAIAEELKHRGVNARTFHSLCCNVVMRATGAVSISGDKLFKLMYAHFREEEAFLYGSFCTRLVSLAKQVGIGCLVPNTLEAWEAIITHHDLELDKTDATEERAIEIASELLELSNSANTIDFDDMLYLPILLDLKLPTFYFIFVDEAQDTNSIQRAILRKLMGRLSRLIAVGDPAQSIYGFRGADSLALNRIVKEFNCYRFPLSTSYRCAKSIVEHAHKWVDHIQAADGAPEGVVRKLHDWDVEMFTSSDLVLCRTTKPLMSLAFRMMRRRIPVTILGRELGDGLIRLIRKAKTNDLETLGAWIDNWSIRESQKALSKMDEAKAASVEDRAACISMMIQGVDDEGGDVKRLINIIEDLFTPTRSSTTLSTIHKAKGTEADTVYWLNSSQCPSKWAKQAWQKKQEENLCYVATTRARKSLYLIEES